MKIQDFCDMNKFEEIMRNWAKSTGLAAAAVEVGGKYISKRYNFTDFCTRLTRSSKEGARRCEKCQRDGQGVYSCHAGLFEFSIPVVLEDGTQLGKVIGGQVFLESLSDDKFRKIVEELGIKEESYIDALKKVKVRQRDEVEAAAHLLGDAINMFVQTSYAAKANEELFGGLTTNISAAIKEIDAASDSAKKITGFSGKQRMLALSASLGAARAGEHGRGFSVVAGEVQKLAQDMDETSGEIIHSLNKLADIIHQLERK